MMLFFKRFRVFATAFLLLMPISLFSAGSLLQGADILYREEMRSESLELYSQWLPLRNSASHPRFPEILMRTVSLLEDPYMAVRLIQRHYDSLETPDSRFDAAFYGAVLSDLSGDLETALDLYRQATSIDAGVLDDPDRRRMHWQAQYRGAAAAAEMGRRVEAAKMLQPLVASCPDGGLRASSALLYSRMLAEQERIPEAVSTAALIFKMKLSYFPPVADYWIRFLLDNYPQEAQSLKEPAAGMVQSQKFLPIEAIPTPAMILSGLAASYQPQSAPIDSSDEAEEDSQAISTTEPVPGMEAAAALNQEEVQNNQTGSIAVKKDVVPMIQLGSFKDRENADYFSLDVKKKGFDSEVLFSKESGYFRVFVISDGKEPLEQLMLRLKDRGLEGYLVFE